MKKAGIPVEFIDDPFGAGGERLAEMFREASPAEKPRLFLVADYNVVQRRPGLGSAIGRWTNERGFSLAGAPVILSGGERIKSDGLESVKALVSAMLAAGLGAGDTGVALGGGALLDVAGYAAAQFRGGLPLVRIPTTPNAMMDGAFAETAAVDGPELKDALSVASVPVFSVIDPGFATTVLDGVWRAGFAEALRFAVVKDAKLVKRLIALAPAFHDRDEGALREIVGAAAELRRKKGGSDFALWAVRRLQEMSSFKMPHGHAVSIAVALELAVASVKCYLPAGERDALLGALAASGAGEAIGHNRHLISYVDSLCRGLGDWRLSTGSDKLVYPAGAGKSVEDDFPDAGTVKEALNLIK